MGRCAALVASALLLGCPGQPAPPTRADPPDDQVEAPGVRATALPAWGSVSPLSAAAAREHGLLAAELDRDPTAEALVSALASGDAALRDRAALSLARIGGSHAAEYFAAWLGDGAREISSASIGAVATLAPVAGAPGEPDEPQGIWATLEANLWTRYAVTDDVGQAEASLLAIARVGGRVSVRNLAVDLQVLPTEASDARRFERGAEALALLCVRRHGLGVEALDALAEGLTAEYPEARRGSAYALSRCAGPSAERLAGPERGVLVERLSPMIAATEPSEAVEAWRALQALGEAPRTIPAAVLGSPAPPWQVEVAAVRGMAASDVGRRELTARLTAVVPSAFEGPRVHVLLEALRALRAAVDGTSEPWEPLAALTARVASAAADQPDPRRGKALALVRCELAALHAVHGADLEAVRRCAYDVDGLPPDYGEVLAIDVLLAMEPAVRIDALVTLASSPNRAVAVAALAGLAEIDDARVNPLLRATMAQDDVGLVAAAAGAIAARAIDRSKRDEAAVPVLLAAIGRLSTDLAVEARIAAVAALGSLARSAQPDLAQPVAWLDALVALATDDNQAVRDAARTALWGWPDHLATFDAAVPPRFPQGFAPSVHAALDTGMQATGLRLQTAAGVIAIDFAGAPAPIAQANLASLAMRGYFDGLAVHRVVPAFVVQGGDPRGDGYGGPGHVMPCEWSNLRFEAGTVGIALAGKDTGGSQVFITHGSPHHLDARYAVVGRVTEGLQVVDNLLPFDTITSVEVVAGPL